MYTTTSMASFNRLPFSIYNDENQAPAVQAAAFNNKRPSTQQGLSTKSDVVKNSLATTQPNRRALGDLSNIMLKQNPNQPGKNAGVCVRSNRLRLVNPQQSEDQSDDAKQPLPQPLPLARPTTSVPSFAALPAAVRQQQGLPSRPATVSSIPTQRSILSHQSSNPSICFPTETLHISPELNRSRDSVHSALGGSEVGARRMSEGARLSFGLNDVIENLNDPTDPACCAEYADGIYRHMLATEASLAASPSYMTRQTDINEKMRAILVDWLVDVHTKFRLLPETLFLACNLLDRLLEKNLIARNKLQLVGTTSMLLASKYEEICVPEIRDFIFISANFYTKVEMIKMESFILNSLEFKLTVPTSLSFLKRFCKAAKVDTRTEFLANFLIELSLVDLQMLKFLPSMVAASALLIAIRNTHSGSWNATARYVSTYSEAHLEACVAHILVLARAPSSLTAIRRKYGSSKFQQVAKIVL